MDKLDEYNEYLKSRFNGVCDFDNALEQYMEKHKQEEKSVTVGYLPDGTKGNYTTPGLAINAELSRIEREKKERTKMQCVARGCDGCSVCEPQWIEWHGGECPVDGDTLVDVKYGDLSKKPLSPADSLLWDHTVQSGQNIIAYRVIEQDKPEHKPCPRCGSDDIREQEVDGDGICVTWYYLECLSCGIMAQAFKYIQEAWDDWDKGWK